MAEGAPAHSLYRPGQRGAAFTLTYAVLGVPVARWAWTGCTCGASSGAAC
jgi:hypothetical protein